MSSESGNGGVRPIDPREMIALLIQLEIDSAVARPPSEAELAEAPLLNRWMFVRDIHNGLCLGGDVVGHPDFEDGKSVATSRLEVLVVEDGWAKTKSRYYRLGRGALEGSH